MLSSAVYSSYRARRPSSARAIVAASLESFFRRPEKGLASAERSRRLTSVADFALEAQGIGPVMVHGQQEHGGEHVGVGGLPDVEARIARLPDAQAYSSRSSCGKSALRVRIRFTSRSVLRRLSMRWATARFVPARIPFNSCKLFFIFSLTPGSTASASRLSSTFSGKRRASISCTTPRWTKRSRHRMLSWRMPFAHSLSLLM